jgi:hypothetical protein
MRITPPTGNGVIFEWPLAFKVIGVIEVSGNRLPSGFALIKVGKGAGSTSGW